MSLVVSLGYRIIFANKYRLEQLNLGYLELYIKSYSLIVYKKQI